jgi:hypothetical protein
VGDNLWFAPICGCKQLDFQTVLADATAITDDLTAR